MSLRVANRSLVFEQLERKLSPTSLLLAIAPLPEATQADIDAWFASGQTQRATATTWKFQHDTKLLLRFVEAETAGREKLVDAAPKPSPAAALAADTWFQLREATARQAVTDQSQQWTNQP